MVGCRQTRWVTSIISAVHFPTLERGAWSIEPTLQRVSLELVDDWGRNLLARGAERPLIGRLWLAYMLIGVCLLEHLSRIGAIVTTCVATSLIMSPNDLLYLYLSRTGPWGGSMSAWCLLQLRIASIDWLTWLLKYLPAGLSIAEVRVRVRHVLLADHRWSSGSPSIGLVGDPSRDGFLKFDPRRSLPLRRGREGASRVSI